MVRAVATTYVQVICALKARASHPIRAVGLGSPVEHALVSLLALNGLRVSKGRWR
jgi:hypothetical protein